MDDDKVSKFMKLILIEEVVINDVKKFRFIWYGEWLDNELKVGCFDGNEFGKFL